MVTADLFCQRTCSLGAEVDDTDDDDDDDDDDDVMISLVLLRDSPVNSAHIW
jgi:hypothetical protein